VRSGARETRLFVALALLAAPGCTRTNPDFTGGESGTLKDMSQAEHPRDVGRREAGRPDLRPDQLVNPNKPQGVDVLLVVDNSGGMAYPQQWLARDVTTLIKGLDALPGGPNYRIAVTTTDMGVGAYQNAGCSATGDAGQLLVPNSCPKPQGNVSYVQRVGNAVNVQGSVDQAVACMIKEQGSDGCGFEQPLKAMKVALANKSFVRSAAALAVVILTNEDDCSAVSNTLFNPAAATLGPYASYRCFQFGVLCNGAQPPLSQTLIGGCIPGQQWLHDVQSEYVELLQTIKPKGWVSLLVIAAPAADPVMVVQTSNFPPGFTVKQSCEVGLVDGYPGFRLEDLVNRFGAYSGFASVCETSYKAGLQGLVLRIQSAF